MCCPRIAESVREVQQQCQNNGGSLFLKQLSTSKIKVEIKSETDASEKLGACSETAYRREIFAPPVTHGNC